jgi:hypothetical protein
MARPCTVCNSLDRASIEIDLANGIALRVIGLRYGLTEDALGRHRSNHMDADLLGRLKTRGVRSDEELAHIRDVESKSLLDNLVRDRARLHRNADRSFEIKDYAGERAALAEARKSSESIGKLLGQLGIANLTINQQINLTQSPEWHVIRTALVRELRPLGFDAIAACHRAIESAEASLARPMEPSRQPVLIEAGDGQ